MIIEVDYTKHKNSDMRYLLLKKKKMPLDWVIFALLLINFVLMGGCTKDTLLKRGDLDYKTINAQKTDPLVMPPDFVAPLTDERYDIPQGSSSTYSEYSQSNESVGSAVVGANGGQEVLPVIDGIEVKGEGRLRWVVVDNNVEIIWDRVKQFWENNGFVIEKNMPSAGILETEWAVRDAKTPKSGINRLLGKMFDNINSYPERDKFRTRLEPGEVENTAEIYITHQGMIEKRIKVSVDTIRKSWEVGPANTELEAEMLYRLTMWLGLDEQRARQAKESPGSFKPAAVLQGGEGRPAHLIIDKPYGPSWRKVGIALDRLGFTLEDRNRSKGIYYVRYIAPNNQDSNKGFWKKLAFWKKPKQPDEIKYQIVVEEKGDGQCHVMVLNSEGSPIFEPTVVSILNLLKDEV